VTEQHSIKRNKGAIEGRRAGFGGLKSADFEGRSGMIDTFQKTHPITCRCPSIPSA
jgi:hypothetical protein